MAQFTAAGVGLAVALAVVRGIAGKARTIGNYSILVLALLAVFVAGLMVGRTPEFLGKKIRATQMKLVVAYVLAIPTTVLILGSTSLVIAAGTRSILNPGLHGLTEVTYAYASVAANNGSAFAGLAANTPWYDTTLGLTMLIGRFAPIVLALAIAGSLRRRPSPRAHQGHPRHRRADVRRVPTRRDRDRRRPHLLPHAHPRPDRRAHHRLSRAGADGWSGRPSRPRPRLVGMTQRKSFGSDNHAGVHPAVLSAIVDANSGDALPYGADTRTEQATAALREIFGAEDAFLVLNGSGANVLGLSLLLRRHEAVICAESAHINTDECGSSERLIGTKLLLVPTPDGKISPELIAEKLSGRGDDHRSQPGVVAITQSTELGTCYTLAELRKIADFCHASDLRLYLDGARLANAAAALDCSLAELAECADVLSFGATKNGAMGAEALIVMRPGLGAAAPYLRKQQTQLTSKMRFVAAQFSALLHDDLWRANANHANTMACRLAEGAAAVDGVDIVHPVQANGVFARLRPRHITALQRDWTFHLWDERQSVVRWMTAFDTTEADVDVFLASIRETATA